MLIININATEKKKKYSSLFDNNSIIDHNNHNINNNNHSEPCAKKRKKQTNWSNKNILAGTTFLMDKQLSVVDRITELYIIYYKYDYFDQSIKHKDRRCSHHDKKAIFIGDIVTTSDGTTMRVSNINIKDNESDGKEMAKIPIVGVTVTDTGNRKVGITSRINKSICSVTGWFVMI